MSDTRTNTERHQQARALLLERIDDLAAQYTEDELGRLAWFEQTLAATLQTWPPREHWMELSYRIRALSQQSLVEPPAPSVEAN